MQGRRVRGRLHNAVAGCSLALLVAACGASPTAVTEQAGALEVTLEFGVHHPAHITWRGMDRLHDGIEVRDNFEVFCWPYTADAVAVRDGDGMVVRLTGKRVDGCGQAMHFGVSYRARVVLFDSWQPSFVRVEHRWTDMPHRTYSIIWD